MDYVPKWISKLFKKKSKSEAPFRRIYKGDVPYLRDSDTDIQRSSLRKSVNGRVARKSIVIPRTRNRASSDIDDDEEDPAPKPVRRQSIARSAPLAHKKDPAEAGAQEKFPDNLVVTARYNIWNFLPKNLFEQLRRVVNFYFLVIAFTQTVIDSPVHPITAVSPLAFVLLVTAVKQGYEDWLRHKNDDQVNNRAVKVLRDGILEEIQSKDIKVGDIVKLESDEQVPTDLLLLGSSDEYLRCQINTANLDGETNLKLRYCPSGLPHFKHEDDFDTCHLIVECEHPCEDLYEFSGSLLIPADKLALMHMTNNRNISSTSLHAPDAHHANLRPSKSSSVKSGDSQHPHLPDFSSGMIRQGMTDFLSIPLSMENLVLRGTRLKNTDYIFGIVVYTGRDTRLARNSEKSEAKFSTVERAVNYYLMFFVGLLLFLVIFCCTMHFAVDWFPGTDGTEGPWYANDNNPSRSLNDAASVFSIIASFTILFNYIIPISLYVTVEMQKFLGSKFFVWDLEMMDEEGRQALCNTSDLNEELGQIEYIFSDKTGTLTQNLMKFHHCTVGNLRYEYKSDQRLHQLSRGRHDTVESSKVEVAKSKELLEFFKTLALCHSVQVVPKRRPSFDVGPTEMKFFKNDKKSKLSNRRKSMNTPEPGASEVQFDPGSWEYQASSPDEKALLEACETLGVLYKGEKEDVLTLDIGGTHEHYKRLMQLEFDADRKCMSVIVENSKGEKWLLTKGAESSIIPKCDHGPTHEVLKNVMDYALMGLRTLAIARKELTTRQYDDFANELRAARRLIKNRQEKVREVYSSIESHMTLIGATGVEDQLQENVPETLQSFAAAGIRVWMLTGDKLETGVNVAVSCGLITASTKQYIVAKTSDGEVIEAKLTEIQNEMDGADNTCFVIDGDSLAIAFKVCPELLRLVSMAAFRVVCCRMAPLQKAQVVQMVKNSPGSPTCCAVGDGANDCAMILAAHVGIGILGKEGRQAARCADFAISKFGYLRRAVLVHGHWYYVRLANLANYFFYKNVVFIMPQFFFSFNSNFSTQPIFNGLFLMNFNIFFSSVPIFIFGLTEQPYSSETLLSQPHLYKRNRKNALMTVNKFLPWFLSSLWHSVVCYYLPYLSWDNFDNMNDVSTFGAVVFTGVIVVANCKIAVETKYLSWWFLGSQVFSYISYLFLTGMFSEVDLRPALKSGEFRHVFFTMLSSVCFWLLMLLVGVTATLPDITFAAFRNSWKQIVRHFKGFGKHSKWLKIHRKNIPIPKITFLFSKRTGSLTISNSTLTSYLPNSA
ncbi:unnamed protein product [Orchesella dallaii]|uniref:Phospholipid-transporting ATPase n=1 Tax=Orchesella dallaii TaxID=48710 RepID=A0ABP1RSB6_9HEXA